VSGEEVLQKSLIWMDRVSGKSHFPDSDASPGSLASQVVLGGSPAKLSQKRNM
jgi:hypothetical protein